jgi:UDP-N-acetylmuramate: L-alanyl-gamma-D-glutamyl-meso-diaminopimelate ligase
LKTFTNAAEFKLFLQTLNLDNAVLLFMSSGDYGGLDLNQYVAENM